MSGFDIYPKRPTQKEVDFYIAKARTMRAEALRKAGQTIAEDIRAVARDVRQVLTGHRHA